MKIERQEIYVECDDGVRLSLIGKSTGESGRTALLLVHGSGVGRWCWDVPFAGHGLMDGLAGAGFPVFALDCRGYGASDKPHGMSVTTQRLAADIIQVAREILRLTGGERVALAGHSSAGAILFQAAARAPELIGRMAALGVRYRKMNPDFALYARRMHAAAGGAEDGYVPNIHHLDIETRLNHPRAQVVDWYKSLIEQVYPRIPGAVFGGPSANPAMSAVADVQAPTLLINGSNDYVVDGDDARALLGDLPCADKGLVVLPGAYHLPFLEPRGHADLLACLEFWFARGPA